MGAMWKEQVPRDERTYTELIRAYGNDGQWEWAEAAFQVMKKEEVHPNALTYTALVAAYGKGGQWDLAEGAIDAMKKMNLRPEDTPVLSLRSCTCACMLSHAQSDNSGCSRLSASLRCMDWATRAVPTLPGVAHAIR
jgi:pentatricopeptide repeat protein